MEGRLGHEGRVVWVSLGMFPQSPGMASPLQAASYSAIFCACMFESKIMKMLYLSKMVCNSCFQFLPSAH